MSSSSDSEDKNIALLRQAVDTNFISDGMFTKDASAENKSSDEQKSTSILSTSVQTIANKPKSQRYIDNEDIEDDMNVSKSMQDFVYKKMSARIANSIEFVDVPTEKKKKRAIEEFGNVRLLKNTDPITKIDMLPEGPIDTVKRKRLDFKRRIVEPDDYNLEEKINMAVLDGEAILQQTETKSWKSKKPKSSKVFNYREKSSILYEVEPKNEFTALRKKNNWSESKIATFPGKSHSK